MPRRVAVVCTFVFLSVGLGVTQANGKLQIHHIDIGQGDGAVLISPGGQVVVFDAGEDMKTHDCTKQVSYLDQLGVKQIDYLYVSHYHFDHIGCVPAVLSQFPLRNDAIDRGFSYPGTTYSNYVAAVGSHRKPGARNQVITIWRVADSWQTSLPTICRKVTHLHSGRRFTRTVHSRGPSATVQEEIS